MSFAFDHFCSQVSLTVCPLIGIKAEPTCYARNVEFGSSLVFQPATIVIEIIALIMTCIMIYHIRSKYTAVGRKEIVMFFYNYILLTIVEMLLISGWIPVATTAYPWFVAIYVALLGTQFWILLLNGFVGFQWAEDGTATSLWSIRISALVYFFIVFLISFGTFQGFPGLNNENPIGLFVVYFVLNAVMVIIYVIMQIVLVINTLDDRWPLGDILFGAAFFTLGQMFGLVLSVQLCEVADHYIDGLFFNIICSLLGVMMVYKYWDSITKEDLEFSVGGKANVWEIREESEPLTGKKMKQ